jgi:hypothetical protein
MFTLFRKVIVVSGGGGGLAARGEGVGRRSVSEAWGSLEERPAGRVRGGGGQVSPKDGRYAGRAGTIDSRGA